MAGSGARQNRRDRRKTLVQNQSREDFFSQKVEKYIKNDKVKEPFSQKVINIYPKSEGQRQLKAALAENRLVFACGPAGTGKTLLAVDRAADLFLSKQVDKMVFCRPAVACDENLGALPGGILEKLAGFLLPLYDELANKLGGGPVAKKTAEGWIRDGSLEIFPVGMMRGRSFVRSAVILDEAQNCTAEQLKMVLTRVGTGSVLFVTGDTEQSDLKSRSGFPEVLRRFEGSKYPVVRLKNSDIQRDPLGRRHFAPSGRPAQLTRSTTRGSH